MFECYFKDKSVLFVTTKNIDYIRNTQELRILKELSKNVFVIYSRRKTYFARLISIFLQLLFFNKKIDSVFIGFAPQLILPFFFWKIRKKIIVIDFFISLYDTLVNDRKIFKNDSLLAKFFHYLDYLTLKLSQLVVVDTKADGDYFVSEFNGDISKIIVLYLEADKKIYFPRVVDKPYYLKNMFVVLYFGSVLPLQGYEIVLKAFELLQNERDIHCFFIGPVNENQKIKTDNVEYISWLPQEKLSEYIAYSDLCLAGHFNAEIDKAKRTIPGKAYIYDAMNKNFILGDNLATRELFSESSRVIFCKMGEPVSLANAILCASNKFFMKTDSLKEK